MLRCLALSYFSGCIWMGQKNCLLTCGFLIVQGRSFISIPSELSLVPAEKCYIPKRHIHTWSGHSKGVNAIRFFPRSGHLILSASMDNTVKIWGVNADNRRCLRTYMGKVTIDGG